MPNRSLSGVVSRPVRVVAPISVKRGKVDPHRARRRPLADDEVELEILHRRIEDFLDRRIEPVDLVDEQDIAVFEIGEKRCEVAGLGDDRAGGRAEIDAELARHDLGERGLAEAGRPGEQHMVERLAPAARRLDEHFEVRADLGLADELGERLRPERGFAAVFVAPHRLEHPLAHCASSLSPRRIRSSARASRPALPIAAEMAAAASPWA